MKKSLRVVISNYDDIKNPYYGGGGAVAVHEVAKRLTAHFDMTVTVITGAYTGSRNECIDGVRYRRLGARFFGPKLGQILYQIFLPWQVMRQEFDVWVESFTPPFSTACLSLFTKRPVIGLTHLFGADEMRRKYRLPFHLIERLGIRTYQYCIAISEAAQRKIARFNPSAQISLIPNGVDHQAFFCEQKEAEYLLYFGRIEMDQKGLDLLLGAYALGYKKIELPLVIAGSGAEHEFKKLKECINRLHLNKRVQLIGRIEGAEEKRELFRKAAIVAMPSRYETLSLVALETLASGTPLVVFDIEGMEWLPRDIAKKAKAFDEGEFARLLIELALDKVEREKLGDAGRAFALGYDWGKITQSYAQTIERVVATERAKRS